MLRVALRRLSVLRERGGMRFELRVPALDLHEGEITAVLGSSGCGKSTLLDVLALALRPSDAELFELYTADEKVDLLSRSAAQLAGIRGRCMGYVLQSGGLLSFLSVRENILLPGRLLGHDDELLNKRLAWLTKRLGISEQLNKKPQHLSGGQRQRAAIARALIHSPLLVLADEPTAAVDQRNALDICAVFKSVVQECRSTLIMVSHDAELARSMADRVVSFDVQRLSAECVVSTLNAGNQDAKVL